MLDDDDDAMIKSRANKAPPPFLSFQPLESVHIIMHAMLGRATLVPPIAKKTLVEVKSSQLFSL